MSKTQISIKTDDRPENLNALKPDLRNVPDPTLDSVANITNLDSLVDMATVEMQDPSESSESEDSERGEENSDHSVDSDEIVSIDDDSGNEQDLEIDIEESSEMDSRTDAEIIQEQAHSKTYSVLLTLTPEDIEKEMRFDSEEDLLDPSNDRLVLKPINKMFQVIWDLYKKQVEAFWTPEKIDFSRDMHDFKKMKPEIQEFIKKILAFFAGADSIVNINIQEQFSKIKVKEANVAYAFQEMMENIHSEVYSDMLDNIITKPAEKQALINAFKTVESIKDMIGWGQAWIESERRIGFSIMAFTIFEGLMFSGAFAAIYWLKNQLGDDKMQGLIGSNEFIARDEGMHTNFGCLMYDYVVHRLSAEEARTMMTEAVEIAKRFNKDAIKVRLIGMNESLMGQYIEYVADRLMVYLGYEKIYNSSIPEAFAFMEQIGILNKNNFFERRTSEYQMAHNKENTADWQFRILDKY